MSTDHSVLSYEKLTPLISANGTHKVKYHADEDWDFHLDTAQKPTDLSLVLPHYRARNQPVEHRLNMLVDGDNGPIKLKICRNFPRSKFCLEVHAMTSDVTIWLPSDFRGQIRHSGRVTFSAGFVNRIMQHVRVSADEGGCEDIPTEDDVLVRTRGQVTFRMWDVQTCAPENTRKETLRRMFGCARKAPETAIDWDFLLED